MQSEQCLAFETVMERDVRCLMATWSFPTLIPGEFFIMRLFPLFMLTLPFLARAGEELPRQTLDCKGVKISYVVVGKGEPVVLIHGLYSSSVMNWQMPGIIDILAKNYQVMAIDMPGHGNSDKPEKEDAYGLAMVDDVVAVMDELKVKKAHLVGYSMGGMIALKLTSKFPDRVISTTLGGMGIIKEGSPLQKTWENLGREGGKVPVVCVKSFGKFALTEDEAKAIKTPLCMLVGERDPCRKLYAEPLHQLREDFPLVEIRTPDTSIASLNSSSKTS